MKRNFIAKRFQSAGTGLTLDTAALAKYKDIVDLSIGDTDFTTDEAIINAAFRDAKAGYTHYGDPKGDPELISAVCKAWEEDFDQSLPRDHVLVSASSCLGMSLAMFAILDPGDEVIVFSPYFALYRAQIELAGGVCVDVSTYAEEDYAISEERLRAAITPRTKAIILNSPNNPTGCVYNEKSLQAVHDAVQGRKIFVICDDVYRQLDYTGGYHSFAEFRDLRRQILLVQSFSKPYAMTGWRMGYLLSDASVKERLELLHQFMVVSTPAPFQTACIRALGCDVTPMLETYRARRSYVLQRLRDMQLPVCTPDGAFYVFPSIREFGLTSAEFCTRMIREAGLAATPGSCFGAEGYIRLTYCYGNDQLREGLDRLEQFVRALRAEGGAR